MNVTQAVPFFMVTDIEASARFYVQGLGCEITKTWEPEGKLQWCWLELGGAALMLQELRHEPGASAPRAELGRGVSTYFLCHDALSMYRELRGRGLDPKQPFVGNGMWVTGVTDPDGYHLFFESETDAPEESVYADA